MFNYDLISENISLFSFLSRPCRRKYIFDSLSLNGWINEMTTWVWEWEVNVKVEWRGKLAF